MISQPRFTSISKEVWGGRACGNRCETSDGTDDMWSGVKMSLGYVYAHPWGMGHNWLSFAPGIELLASVHDAGCQSDHMS